MAFQNNTMDVAAGLRVADVSAKPASRLAAGPFDTSSARRDSQMMTVPDALITGLLIIYPALATVVAVIVGLFLSNPVVGL